MKRQINWRDTYREGVQALRTTYFSHIALLMLALILFCTLGFYLLERRTGSLQGMLDSIWWVVVTVSTVGYGDTVPQTNLGRLVGFILMFSGMILVSLFTAAIASVFVSRKIKEDKGLEDVRARDHILICGWNDSGLALIRGLLHHLKPKPPLIVLVNELPREEVDAILYHFPDIEFQYVRGNFTKEEILARANVQQARAAIILSDTSGAHSQEKADERTVFGCLAIKSLAPKVKTCAELCSTENKEHLVRANVDEIVVRGEYNAAILAGAASTTGLSTVMKRLFDVEEENKLWRAPTPDRYVGKTIVELAEFMRKKYSAILMAVVTETSPIRLDDILSPDRTAIDDFIRRKFEASGKDYFSSGKPRMSVTINPADDYVLTRQDAVIVLGRTRPEGASFLEKSIDLVKGGS